MYIYNYGYIIIYIIILACGKLVEKCLKTTKSGGYLVVYNYFLPANKKTKKTYFFIINGCILEYFFLFCQIFAI